MKSIKVYFSKMSYRTRIRLGIILVIFLVTGFGVSVSIYKQGQDQIRAMDELGGYVAINLSENSVLGILSEEQANLEHPLKAALSDEQVWGAGVYSASGKLIGSMQREEYLLDFPGASEQLALVDLSSDDVTVLMSRSRTGKRFRSYFARVMIEQAADDVFTAETAQNQLCGFVRIDMSLDKLFERKASIFRQNLFLMPIYIFIGIFFSIVVEHHISRPLRRLKDAAVSVSQGDFSKKMEVAARDELGLLADAFNNMSSELSNTIGKLNQSNEELGKMNKELHDFTYIISHDLQEPLRKVHSFAQFLAEDCYEQLSEEGKDYIDRIQKATIKMKSLIQDLLKLSRVGTADTSFTKVNSNRIVSGALDDLSVAIAESKAEITVEPLPDVIGQSTLLTQLFENLIGNALKYRHSVRTPKIKISATQQAGEAVFSIADNGIGIEKKFLGKIFGVFQRLHSTGYEGTGIGLALCRKIIKRHGGRIWAESTEGEGTTFYFTLKIYDKQRC